MARRIRDGDFRPMIIFIVPFLFLGLLTPGPARGQELPPDEAGSVQHLDASSRHGEWVDYDAGEGDMVRAWVVYPERSDPAPVVGVISTPPSMRAICDAGTGFGD